MRPYLSALVFFGICFGYSPAHAQNEVEWRGIHTTETITGCRIIGTGQPVSQAAYGYGYHGQDMEFGSLLDAATEATQALDDLKKEALHYSRNAVIGARVEVSHSSDAVFESGTNWTVNGRSYDHTMSYIVVSYGTAVTVACEDDT